MNVSSPIPPDNTSVSTFEPPSRISFPPPPDRLLLASFPVNVSAPALPITCSISIRRCCEPSVRTALFAPKDKSTVIGFAESNAAKVITSPVPVPPSNVSFPDVALNVSSPPNPNTVSADKSEPLIVSPNAVK